MLCPSYGERVRQALSGCLNDHLGSVPAMPEEERVTMAAEEKGEDHDDNLLYAYCAAIVLRLNKIKFLFNMGGVKKRPTKVGRSVWWICNFNLHLRSQAPA